MFTIRVYGILINEAQQVLVSDEYIRGSFYTKFPGGGLEPGEGTRDCLVREFMEEMNLKVSVGDHIYTTDIYQRSAFNNAYQIVAIYYLVKALEPITVPLRDKAFHFDTAQLEVYNLTQQIETFRFVDWVNFLPDAVTLSLDKIAVERVIQMKKLNK